MAVVGLLPSDFPEEVVEVWPENWQAVQFFAEIPNGAWTIVAGVGAVGLRPEALREVRESLGLSLDEWRPLFRDIQTMEAEALKTMRDNQR